MPDTPDRTSEAELFLGTKEVPEPSETDVKRTMLDRSCSREEAIRILKRDVIDWLSFGRY